MAWVRIDDQMPQHPKVVQAGPFGFALQVAALCYANRYLTDGFIPKQVVKHLLNDCLDDLLADAENKVVQAGLWDVVEGGYQIHDYLKYQPSRAQVESARAQKQASGQAGGVASAKARAKAHGQAEFKQNSTPNPNPNPNPNPKITPPTLPPTDFPEWYNTLMEIPSFTRAFSEALRWFEKSGCSVERAESTAYALKSKWPPSSKHKDVWATFQGWVKSPPLQQGSTNGTARGHNQKGLSLTEQALSIRGEAERLGIDPFDASVR